MHMAKDLKAYANVWADKFVDTNLRPHLASWLLQLEDAYPKELPKLKARLGKTPFTAMGVTKNYVSVAHTNRDILYSVISWFIRNIIYFPFVFLVFPFYQFCFRFILCLCDPFQGMWRVWGFVFLGFSLFFRPRSGTMLLLNSSRLSHYMAPVLNPGHCKYGCALYVRWSTRMTYVSRQNCIEQMGDMLDSAML